VNSGPCTVSGSILTPTASGTCFVTAFRAADGSYNASSSASTSILIAKAKATASYSISSPPIFRTNTTISVTVSTAATVKFLMNGKAIPGCQSKSATSLNSYVASCLWKPSARNYVSLSMQVTPVSSSFNTGILNGPTYLVAYRTGTR
jgi:hypothetical protein